jgi:protein transport protein HofB
MPAPFANTPPSEDGATPKPSGAWHASTWLQQQLQQALLQHSSDIHLDRLPHSWHWRWRIQGQLMHQATLAVEQGQAVLACIKVKAQLDITEHRRPQKGRFLLHHQQHLAHARVTLCPCFWGEKASIRLLYGANHLRSLDQLGMDQAQQLQFTRSLQHSHGLVLVCGPTGSGKSQTLSVAMQQLAQQGKHCLSLEDPVEMPMPGVSHIQIQTALGLGYAQGLKTCLRMDPDVILIGEIRDHETAQLAIHAAQSGHLILSTVHSPHLLGVFDRMRHLGVSEHTLAPLCRLIINQRLLPLLCSHCKALVQAMQPSKPSQSAQPSQPTYQAMGCEHCHDGYMDRLGLFECWTLPVGISTCFELEESHQQAAIQSIQTQAQLLWQQGQCDLKSLRATR